jgi:S-adenosylhomocysteine hydrolase
MTQYEKLPVLEALFNRANIKEPSFGIENILFVCVQHLLHTSVDLFETLIALGANPKHIFLLGKHYSTCNAVATRIKELGIQLQELTPLQKLGEYTPVFNADLLNMWQKVQDHLKQHDITAAIVLDDGGKCLEFITHGILKELPTIGIEQTTAGLFNPTVINLKTPFIDVASCAVKIHLESNLIIEAILEKLNVILPLQKNGLICGVVGVGVIGKAVIEKLLSLEHNVLVYDQEVNAYDNVKTATSCDSLEQLFSQADYIFGCTGRDITENLDLEKIIDRNKVFISCTSEDKEFLSLLKNIENKHSASNQFSPLNDIKWSLQNGAVIHIIKGGFPVNFDDSGESVSAHKIQLTRGLLLIAIIQAIVSLPELASKSISGRVMLDPEAQKFIVNTWLNAVKTHNFSDQLIDKFKDIEWILSNSGGTFYESAYIKKSFAVTQDWPLVGRSIN